jgi:predicted XRE-type DNA-binding protein
MRTRVKQFETWLSEAVTEASPAEIQNLLGLVVPVIRKSVDDTMRFELEYAKKLKDAKTDIERTRLFNELNEKKSQAEEPITQFLTMKAKMSQTQLEKVMSWSKSMMSLLMDKKMSAMEDEFKEAGADVSRWKEMYNPSVVNNEMLKRNQRFEQETGVKPPLVS